MGRRKGAGVPIQGVRRKVETRLGLTWNSLGCSEKGSALNLYEVGKRGAFGADGLTDIRFEQIRLNNSVGGMYLSR